MDRNEMEKAYNGNGLYLSCKAVMRALKNDNISEIDFINYMEEIFDIYKTNNERICNGGNTNFSFEHAIGIRRG